MGEIRQRQPDKPEKADKPPRDKAPTPEERRAAILSAALKVFAENGFAGARLDDIAAKAGVAKGTLYLYFPNKEALFEELVRAVVSPIIDRLAAAAELSGISFAALLEQMHALFRSEILNTDRKLILRLLITEGPRFPALAEFYYKEIVSRGLGVLRAAAARAVKRGELESDEIVRFPQLVFAPLITSLIWDSLFGGLEPLDVEGLLAAHRKILTAKEPSCDAE